MKNYHDSFRFDNIFNFVKFSNYGLDLYPIWKEGRQDNNVILHSYADMTRTKDTLHFTPKKTIDVGMKEMIKPMLVQKWSNQKWACSKFSKLGCRDYDFCKAERYQMF